MPQTTSDLTGSVALIRLKWAFLVTLLVLFVFVEFARYNLRSFLDTWSGRLMMDLVILVGGVFFFGVVFNLVSRLQMRLERQNRELLALHWAALDIYGEVSLGTVLQKVVDQARQLLEATYGAIAVYDDKGLMKEFMTSGMTDEVKEGIGTPPEGRGLLGVVLRQGQRIRLPDVARDPRSIGFPPNHPDMHSLLAIPIVCKGPFRGNLYVAEKITALEFAPEDEETLVRFATAAAIAIDNAHLNQRLRTLAVAEERVRIAREIHDGMAQILAYVNTKAQAVKAYLDKDKPEQASAQLEQLASAAREVYTDAREGIMALRTRVGPDQPLGEALRDYVERWEMQSGITSSLEIEGEIQVSRLGGAPAAARSPGSTVQRTQALRSHQGRCEDPPGARSIDRFRWKTTARASTRRIVHGKPSPVSAWRSCASAPRASAAPSISRPRPVVGLALRYRYR